jgi:glucokinase
MIGAVDIGGTKIAVGMVDDSGRVLSRCESPTNPQQGPAIGLERIIEMLRKSTAQAGERLSGIGIGCTGPVNPFTGTLELVDFLPGWEGTNLTEPLSNFFGVPTAMENDADAAALGESAWGAGRGARRFFYVTISTGIGAGFVIDGQLYRGVEGAHPETGHHIIDPSGPACLCGAHGCWESLAGGLALARRGGYPTAREVCNAAECGEPAALSAVEREGYYLGLGFSNLVTLFSPDIIAIGGGVMRSRHLFWDAIQASIRQNCGIVPNDKTVLVPAALGDDTGLVGAACVWINRFGGFQ